MPRIKITSGYFSHNFTGTLPGKDPNGISFINGMSEELTLAQIDRLAASLGGDLVNDNGDIVGPAGITYRRLFGNPLDIVITASPIAGRTFVANEGGGLGETNKQVMSQTRHVIVNEVTDDSFTVEYPNWGATAGQGEWTRGAAATGRASMLWINQEGKKVLSRLLAKDGTETATAADGDNIAFFLKSFRPLVGSEIKLRFWGNFPNGGYYSHYIADYANGDKLRYGATMEDLTGTETDFASSWEGARDSYAPVFIGAVTTKPTVVIDADSRGSGMGDVANTLTGHIGSIARQIGPRMAYLNISIPGATAAERADPTKNVRRNRLAKRASFRVDGLGINDMLFQGATEAVTWANKLKIAEQLGLSTIYETIAPAVVSKTVNTPARPEQDAVRLAHNTRLLALPGSIAAAAILEQGSTGTLKTLADTDDGTHHNNLGNGKIVAANLVDFTKLGSPAIINPGFEYSAGAIVQALDVSGFSVTGTVQAANTVYAPNHKMDGLLLKEDASLSGSHNLLRQITAATAGKTLRATLFAKRVTGDRNLMIQLQQPNVWNDGRAVVDLGTGKLNYASGGGSGNTVINVGAVAVTKIEDWIKIELPVIFGSEAVANPYVFLKMLEGTNETYNGDGASSIALWGLDIR